MQLIPDIVQTCKVCREWAKPGPDHECSVEIPDKFTVQVECDPFLHTLISIWFAGAHNRMLP